MITDYTIFVDIDGVLANFSEKASEILGAPLASVSSSKLWTAITKYDKEIGPFFESLKKLPGADELASFVTQNFANYSILTATGFTPSNGAEQKRVWISKNFPQFDGKVITVRKSMEKAKYAAPNHILIDDQRKSIDPWIQSGGIGILYETSGNTVAKLNQLLNNGSTQQS